MFSFIALLLLGLASGGFSHNLNRSVPIEQNVEPKGSHVYLAEELPFVAGYAVKEGTGFWSAGNPVPGSYKQPQFFKVVIRALEIQIACEFLQNISQLDNNPVRIRKSDMLFPFHYFFEPGVA